MRSTFSLIVVTLLLIGAGHAQQPVPQAPPGVSDQLQNILGGALKPSSTKTPAASTMFVPTDTPLFVDTMTAKLTLDAEQKDAFRKYVAQIIAMMNGIYQQYGFQKNDLGVALGGLLETCYELDQGTFKLQETDKAAQQENKRKTVAVVRQIQQTVGSNPAFKKIPDRARQLAYEACAFSTGHLAVSWQQAGTDEAKRDAVRKLAREQIRSFFQIDPNRLTRNAAGEFIAKKADTDLESGDAPAKETPAPPTTETPASEKGNENADVSSVTDTMLVTPNGWKAERLNGGAVRYSPQNLDAGLILSVAVYPLRPLKGKQIEEWMQSALVGDPNLPGKMSTKPTIKAASGNFVSGNSLFVLPDGRQVLGLYQGLTFDKETIRLIRIVTNPNDSALSRYKSDIGKITDAVIKQDRQTAVSSGRGLDIEKLPPTPQGMRPGGALKPGIYAGSQLYGSEVRERYRLYLYADGQFRLYNKEGKEIAHSSSEYKYDPRSGRIDFDWGSLFDMSNDRRDPSEDYCLYGRTAAGEPYIYAYSNRGFNGATTRLTYAGALDKPSLKAETEAKEAAEAEAKRFKWVVPAGQGVKASQIAAVLMNQDLHQFYNGSGMTVYSTYELYLLLNDGTVYNDLPVPPDELDIALSRRKEPAKWGHWKRQGKAYVAAWPDAPGKYEPLKGFRMQPAPVGTRLAARYGTGDTSGSMMGGSYRLWGITFAADGHFRQDRRGGYGSSTFAQTGGAPSINSTYDEKGSFTSATGENFTVATGRKNRSGGDHTGTYSLNGYVLTLHYDNGKVARLPFFFGDDRKMLWFEGSILSKDNEKL